MFLWIILGVVLLYLFYQHAYKPTKYWEKRGVTHEYAFPILGSFGRNLFQRRAIHDVITTVYNKFPNSKYFGIHQATIPILLVRDPKIIKELTVKDFDSFMNHTVILTEDNEPLFGKNLVSLKGQKWKDMRSTLSPAFTSAKMKTMFHLITKCSEQFVEYFLKEAETTGVVDIEMKDIFTRYANDVIATAAFGIECDSLTHKENEFYMIGKKSTTFGTLAMIKILGYTFVPSLMKMFGIKLMPQSITDFFSDIILTTLSKRERENIIRPDMIHLLMQAKKGQLKHDTTEKESSFSAVEESSVGESNKDKPVLTDEDIIAQAFLFFFAGYDTGSTLMGFMAYELAVNPDIQKKLQDEIDELFDGNKVDYENILKLKYLDMVCSESLRIWPPAVLIERQCEKSYTLETSNDNEEPALIEKDISVWIPVYSIHHDPKYFPESEKFDPERFSDENKHNILPFTYLPFGSGPRNCIGSRFALLEIKVLFVHLLRKFELTVISKTQIPLKIKANAFNLTPEKGIWLGLKPRAKRMNNTRNNT